MSEDTDRRLRLMKFWLFGTFLLLWAISFTYYFLYLAPISDLLTVLTAVWPVWAVAAVGAVAVYYFYKWWLGRDEGDMAPNVSESEAPPPSEPPSYSQPGEG